MNPEWTPERNREQFAQDFVPPSHRHLHVLRLFLPLVTDDGVYCRWSDFPGFDDASASVSLQEVVQTDPFSTAFVSCRGVPDQTTLQALSDIAGSVTARTLEWAGYGQCPNDTDATGVGRNSYFARGPAPLSELVGARLPEFVMDSHEEFAWGARPYPDSLVVAASLTIFRALHADARLDTISVVSSRDVLPPSAGD